MSTLTINNLYNRNSSSFGLILSDINGNIIGDTVVKTNHTYNNISPGFYDVWNYDVNTEAFVERLVGLTVNASPPLITNVLIRGVNISAAVSGSDGNTLSISTRRAFTSRPRSIGSAINNSTRGSLMPLAAVSGVVVFILLLLFVVFLLL